MFDYREIAEKYNLELVAGNFFQVFLILSVWAFVSEAEVEDTNSYIYRSPGVGFGLKR